MNVLDRKHHFIYSPHDAMKRKMKKSVDDIYKLFDDSCSDDSCWLHPEPPPACPNGRPKGAIISEFSWRDASGKHKLRVNIGIVALIIKHQLTRKRMEGYVHQSWHLSHLCGNWTCCNWRHMTVESGRINVSRNQCFLQSSACRHDPPCMKDRKRRLLVTPAISTKIKMAIESTGSGAKSVTGCQIAGSYCGICGKDVNCFGDSSVCLSLASLTKSRKALEKLESCLEPRYEVFEAISYLKQIIGDLIRERKASDAASL